MRNDGSTAVIISRAIDDSDGPNVSDETIEELVVAAQPRIAAILGRYRTILSPEVLDDIRSTVTLRVVRRLRSPGDDPIASFDDFVATTTFNCVNDVLRHRAPARTQLKDRLRQLFARSERLASWHMRDGIAAGFIEWRGMPAQELRAEATLPRDDLERAVIVLLEDNGTPLPFEAIVDAIAVAWAVAEIDSVPIETVQERIASTANDAEADAEIHDELRVLWQEVRDLRRQQRQALLLNLRDHNGASAIELFVFLRITTIDDIAAALEMEPETLAALWNSLPLDDHTIGARLGVTRQQVINLRRAARERLARRLHNTKR